MSYSDGTGRTPGILNGLGAASAPDNGTLPANYAGSPKPDAKRPGNMVVNTQPNNQAPQLPPMKEGEQAHPQIQARALGVLKSIGQGKLVGVHVPSDAPKLKSSLTPGQVSSFGVGIYKPTSKDVAAVFYNPKQVPLTTLKAMDKAGRLDNAFPSIMSFLKGRGSVNAPAGGPRGAFGEPGASAPAGSATGTSANGSGGPPGRNVASASDLNLTGTPGAKMPAAVPVLPKPGATAGFNATMASKRVAGVNGPPPSQQSNPSSGLVSGLWRAPV